MSDTETRSLRRRLHIAFDPIWQEGFKSRDAAYAWLASELGIDRDDCHISWLDKEALVKATKLAKEYYSTRRHRSEARGAKKKLKFHRRADRERNRITRRKFRD